MEVASLLSGTVSSIIASLIVAALIAAAGGLVAIRVIRVDFKNLRELIASGFEGIHNDIRELKLQAGSHDERLRKLEISQAFREGREQAAKGGKE